MAAARVLHKLSNQLIAEAKQSNRQGGARAVDLPASCGVAPPPGVFALNHRTPYTRQSRIKTHTNRILPRLFLFESCCHRNWRHDATTAPLFWFLPGVYCLSCKVGKWNKTFEVAHDNIITNDRPTNCCTRTHVTIHRLNEANPSYVATTGTCEQRSRATLVAWCQSAAVMRKIKSPFDSIAI